MTSMSSPANPADTRALIIERLVGETGEPDRVIAAARDLAERAAPAITTALDELLSFPVAISVASISIARMIDAKPTEGTSSALCVAASAVSPDALVLLLDTGAVGLFTAAFFGGDPELRSAAIDRDLSAIELDVANTVFGCVAEAVNGGGARSLTIRLPVPEAIAGGEIQKQALRDGPAVRIEFLASSSAGVGRIVLTMPQRLMLKPRGEGGAAKDPAWGSRFSDEVIRSRVTLEASIPMNPMTLGALRGLAVGQTIELPISAQGQTKLSSRGKTLFLCEFGKLGGNYTVRVRRPFDAEQELLDDIRGS